jgi:tetratricopeptide (TPR) repeat protein
MGQPDQARSHYKKARTLLEKKVHEWPDDARIHAELGKVYAHLGFKDKAISEAQTAVDLIPVSKDAWEGAVYLARLAEIYTIVGDFDAAVGKLEYLLEIPSEVHIGELKVEQNHITLQNPREARRRRHGRGLQSPGHQTGPDSSSEVSAKRPSV